MSSINTVAVFCGSNFGYAPIYAQAARQLGQALANRSITLVYGGTDKGLMGTLADACLEAGGHVIGVINQRLHDRGHLHPGLDNFEISADMRSRKARMAELSDAFIALPGGLGTLEELLEMATLSQLGDHANRASKPCGVLNIDGFFDSLFALLQTACDAGFMKLEHVRMIESHDQPNALLDSLQNWNPPQVTKWIDQPTA